MRHVGTLIGLCVAAGVATLVFGAVAAPAEEPATTSDMTVHQADMTGTTPVQDSKEESAITTNPSGAGTIGPETERQLSVPDDRPGTGRGPTSEDRDMTREQDALSSLAY